LLPSDGDWPPEIDVMEVLGHDLRTLYVHVHSKADGPHVSHGLGVPVPDLSTHYHVFGASWRPDMVRFYLDDVEVYATKTPGDMQTRPMYLLANISVGGPGSWPGAADPAMRGTMFIDWIRAWQFLDLIP
jgi:beta-glucanase (GH16 family)